VSLTEIILVIITTVSAVGGIIGCGVVAADDARWDARHARKPRRS
jgi:hypothetical protein